MREALGFVPSRTERFCGNASRNRNAMEFKEKGD
jgi:hypothetical protein